MRHRSNGKVTWNAEEDHLLALPLLAGIIFLGKAAGGWVGIGDGSPPNPISRCLCELCLSPAPGTEAGTRELA